MLFSVSAQAISCGYYDKLHDDSQKEYIITECRLATLKFKDEHSPRNIELASKNASEGIYFDVSMHCMADNSRSVKSIVE